VFSTQKLVMKALYEMTGIETTRENICVNVVGVNHFTWFSEAKYQNMDLFPIYTKFVDKFYESGYSVKHGNVKEQHWANHAFVTLARVRMDLFKRFGFIAAAGDRHLAEFMDNTDYLGSPENVDNWRFHLTSVQWRKDDLVTRKERSERLYSGEEVYELRETGEEGVQQITALLGLDTMVTNVNIPNMGQISNLPIGTVVETNAAFRDGNFRPVYAGNVPDSIYPMISRAARENDMALDAGFSQDLEYAYTKFRQLNMIKTLTEEQKRDLFDEMIAGTKKYLGDYK
jgi:alpha-galactosidase